MRDSREDHGGDGPVADGSVTVLFAQFRAGAEGAAGELWNRFLPRLCGLARKTLAGHPQRIADAEDAVQSAFASFWIRAGRGDFPDVVDRQSLWNLLAAITVRKARKQVIREKTQKRGGGQVLGEDQFDMTQSDPFQPKLADELNGLTPGEFDLHCEELLQQLSEPLRELAVLRLMGHSNQEIAEFWGCTNRKVQRKLELIRLKWMHLVEE